jgi:hypothetical protein
MIELDYWLIIEATDDNNIFGSYSRELPVFSGIGHSVEDCLYKAKWGMRGSTWSYCIIDLSPSLPEIRIRKSLFRMKRHERESVALYSAIVNKLNGFFYTLIMYIFFLPICLFAKSSDLFPFTVSIPDIVYAPFFRLALLLVLLLVLLIGAFTTLQLAGGRLQLPGAGNHRGRVRGLRIFFEILAGIDRWTGVWYSEKKKRF